MRVCKPLLVAASIFFIGQSLKAQWSTNGTSIYYNGGNVGIGTNSPDSKLQVIGNADIGDAYDPTKYGILQLTRPANQGDNKFHLSFIRSGNCISGIGYALNSNVFGIWYANDNTATPSLSFAQDQKVGVGTSAPADRLHVANGNLRLDNGYEIYFADNGQIRSLDNSHRILFRSSENKMELREYGSIVFSAGAIDGTETAKMVIQANGYVGIGTTSPQSELAVKGTITSQKVKVTQTGWADYVFDNSYKLRRLTEVENYIQQYHHLPEVPSAEEVEKKGLDVGDNQATLLKKIEELTLYAIEQNKKIEQQSALLKKQEERLEVLENELKNK